MLSLWQKSVCSLDLSYNYGRNEVLKSFNWTVGKVTESWSSWDCHWSLVLCPSSFLHWSWKWTLRFVKNVKASSSIIPPDSTFGKSPKLWPSAKVQLHIPATLNVLCKSCTCARGKVQLYGNTCSVIVSSQGTHRKQMKRASAKLSHLLQPTQFRVFTFLLFSTYVEAVFSKELLLMTELFRFHTTKTHKKWGEKHWIISS